MRRVIGGWRKRRTDRGSVWPEAMFACFIGAWGIAFLNPTNAFAASPNYAALATIAPESAWGISLSVIGIAWLAILILGFNHLRIIAGIIGAAILLWMGVSIFLSNPNSTWAGPTSIVGIGAAYSAVRLATLWTQLRQPL